MLTVAASSSVIVIVASSLAAFTTIPESLAVIAVSVIVRFSVASTMSSFRIETGIVAVVCPWRILTVPDSAVKSLPDVAEPVTVYETSVSVPLAADCVTVNKPFVGDAASTPFVVAAMLTEGAGLSMMLCPTNSNEPPPTTPPVACLTKFN